MKRYELKFLITLYKFCFPLKMMDNVDINSSKYYNIWSSLNIEHLQELVWEDKAMLNRCWKTFVYWTVIQPNKLASVMYCVKWCSDAVECWPAQYQVFTSLKVCVCVSYKFLCTFCRKKVTKHSEAWFLNASHGKCDGLWPPPSNNKNVITLRKCDSWNHTFSH